MGGPSDDEPGRDLGNGDMVSGRLIILISLNFVNSTVEVVDLPEDHVSRQLGRPDGPCWGYEDTCRPENAFTRPKCSAKKDRYTGRNLSDIFSEQADFGYLQKILLSMDSFCEAEERRQSSLYCAKNLLFCMGRNIYVDLRDVQNEQRNLKYQMDVLKDGQIGGICGKFHGKRLLRNVDFMSPLQSWAPELRFFKSGEVVCDHVEEKTTFIVKLDATVNMYHHFCDFFNLYATHHLVSHFNHTAAFDRDVNIFVWENEVYRSNFGVVFEAFTRNKLLNLNSFGRSRVCFRNAVFALPPRMVFGLFYNTPIVKDCEQSGLFKAFSEFLVHRLSIPVVSLRNSRRLQVTLISRQTEHRRILNERELIKALKESGQYEVTVARFTHRTSFKDQIQRVHHSDILIGMHGAGLTHCLFLNDWAVLFELYHCEDQGCYSDLARLRGVKYITWTNETLLEKQDNMQNIDEEQKAVHSKFTNYKFDVEEFLKKVAEAAGHVLGHPKFRALDVHRSREEL